MAVDHTFHAMDTRDAVFHGYCKRTMVALFPYLSVVRLFVFLSLVLFFSPFVFAIANPGKQNKQTKTMTATTTTKKGVLFVFHPVNVSGSLLIGRIMAKSKYTFFSRMQTFDDDPCKLGHCRSRLDNMCVYI
ncbi:hypothetical protein CEXT_557291 [Caerostris extrusa]|uniref:Transmembrane protein n=1 Tax=Caerostris extrusa TaxID=172846 RepID=A0AAV4P026_CAEEX|nr:hypothetical protein CEXT_557291 [Caerostris extrusa]